MLLCQGKECVNWWQINLISTFGISFDTKLYDSTSTCSLTFKVFSSSTSEACSLLSALQFLRLVSPQVPLCCSPLGLFQDMSGKLAMHKIPARFFSSFYLPRNINVRVINMKWPPFTEVRLFLALNIQEVDIFWLHTHLFSYIKLSSKLNLCK